MDLTPKEFDLLELLAVHPHRAYDRETLVEQLWGNYVMGETRVVDTYVNYISEKVQIAGLSYNPIQTVWGVGNKLFVVMNYENK